MRNLLILALIILAYSYIKKFFRSAPSFQKKEKKTEQIMDEMVQDPVCRIYVPKNESVKKNILGQDLFFCGSKCAEEYEKKSSSKL